MKEKEKKTKLFTFLFLLQVCVLMFSSLSLSLFWCLLNKNSKVFYQISVVIWDLRSSIAFLFFLTPWEFFLYFKNMYSLIKISGKKYMYDKSKKWVRSGYKGGSEVYISHRSTNVLKKISTKTVTFCSSLFSSLKSSPWFL